MDSGHEAEDRNGNRRGKVYSNADYEAKGYSYMPEQKTAFEIDLTELQAPETPTDYVENTDTTGSEFLGTEEIDGIECYKFSVVPKTKMPQQFTGSMENTECR